MGVLGVTLFWGPQTFTKRGKKSGVGVLVGRGGAKLKTLTLLHRSLKFIKKGKQSE